MITGTKVNFVYVESGASIPTPVDESTIYYVKDAQQMYVGSRLIADSSKIQDIKINGSSAVDPSTHEASIELPYNICIESFPSTPASAVSFSNGSPFPLLSLTVGVDAWQEGSGDPSPSNERPIHGWDEIDVSVSGVNVWDEEWEVGDINSNGVPVSVSDRIRSKNFIPVKPNTTYYLKCPTVNARIITYDKNKNFVEYYSNGINNRTFTVGSNVYYIKFYMFPAYGTTYNNDISINYPSTDTEYHAYNGQTYTSDLNGTRYGGTLDVVSGSGTDIIKAFEVDEASDIEMITSHIFRINKSKYPDGKFDEDSIEGLLCEKFKPQISDMPYNICYLTSNGLIIRTIEAYANTSEFFSAIGSFKFTYPLATPITYDTQPTAVKSLDGVNNLFADSGQILDGSYIASSSYVVDVSESIVQLGVNDTTLAKNFADEYDASTSYEVGNLCTKDLVLYKCTTATTGTWDDTEWESATIAEILDAIKTVINSLMVDIDIEVISRLIQKDELLDIMNYGDQLNINWANGTTNYDMPLNLCHLETAKDENDNDVKVADFESEYILPFDCVFDAPEAIFASASDLEAGDYYFKIVNDAWGGNNGKYVSFTLDATLEAGKQIRKKSGAYNAAIEDCTLGIFIDGTDTTGTTLSFTVSTAQPSTGTNLGQTDGTGDLNYWHCVVLGYNRWKFSAVRQFLNSDATKGNWWVQQHKWDVMPSYATTADGFLYGLSVSIKNHLKTTKIQTARNTVFNSGDTPLGDFDTTYDKVFLASLEQMYVEPQVTGEGDIWEYYKLLNGTSTKYQRSSTYADLIKYDISAKTTARSRWLRSCDRSYAPYEWYVYSSGLVSSSGASGGVRLAPAMRIG